MKQQETAGVDFNNPQTLISPDVSQLQRFPPLLFMNDAPIKVNTCGEKPR